MSTHTWICGVGQCVIAWTDCSLAISLHPVLPVDHLLVLFQLVSTYRVERVLNMALYVKKIATTIATPIAMTVTTGKRQ